MTATVGYLAILVAAFSSVGIIIQGFRGMRNPELARAEKLQWPIYGMIGGAFLAMIALEVGILTDDFSIAYIANNSATTTPFIFKVASAWAALEGSIVLWGLVLAAFVYTVYRGFAKRTEPDRLGAGALAVMGIVTLYFFVLMATVSNPFTVCVQPASIGCLEATHWPWADSLAALEGRGPNPLLQNHILMAVHPPMLYVGYVGMTVPFAFAMAALMLGASGTEWLLRTR
ncbi:MAG: cytochrome c biogenesis protein CcsA, partial [Acidimicrobiia bacterium]